MTLESRDTLCDANPPIFRRRPNYRPFRCLEEKDRSSQSSGRLIGDEAWSLAAGGGEEVGTRDENRIERGQDGFFSRPLFDRIREGAPERPSLHPKLAAFGARRNEMVVCQPSFVVLVHPVPELEAQSNPRHPHQKGKRGGGGRGRPSFSFCRQGQMAWNLKELDRGGGVASSSQKGDGHPNPGQIRVGQHRITSPLADEDSTSNR